MFGIFPRAGKKHMSTTPTKHNYTSTSEHTPWEPVLSMRLVTFPRGTRDAVAAASSTRE